MNFSDIIKGSVLESLNGSEIPTMSIVSTILAAIMMGLFIFAVYRVSTRSGFYNKGFNKALASMPLITAGIMLAMQSNMVISLGMVGALSIVRFRNAIKDSSDLMYLFWSISMGIIIGVGQYKLAVLLSLSLTALFLFLDAVPVVKAPCMLIISTDLENDEKELIACVKKRCPKAKVRSHNVTKRGVEWIFEIQVKEEAELVRQIAALAHVDSVNMISHDGEVRF